MIAGTLALLIAGSGTVSYERLATPLPELLTDIGSMVHKKVVCAPELAEDRLCISVTDVDPRTLLDKVAEACAAKIVEDDSFFTLVPDPDYESDIVTARNKRVDAWHAAWRKELANPVRIANDTLDIHELADFVTPAVLKNLPFGGSLVFSRPLRPGGKYLSNTVPDYYKRLQNKNVPYAGVEIHLDDSNGSLQVWMGFVASSAARNQVQVVYTKIWSAGVGSARILSSPLAGDSVPSRRMRAFGLIGRLGTNSSIVSMRDIGLFADKDWGDEPLNAMTAPFLVSQARNLGTDLVCFLDDNAIQSVRGSETVRQLLRSNLADEREGWTVARPVNPRFSRRDRFDRKRLASYCATMRNKGFADFWQLADYLAGPRPAPANALVLEGASVGPVALFSVSQGRNDSALGLFLVLRRDTVAWSALQSGKEVPFSSLPRDFQASFNKFVQGPIQLTATITTGAQLRNNGSRQTVANVTSRPVGPSEFGFDRGVPPNASIRIVKSSRLALLGRHSTREYVTVADINRYATCLVQSEVGKGNQETDAVAILDGFVPLALIYHSIEVGIGQSRISGITIGYSEPFGNKEFVPLDRLPQDVKKEIDRTLAEARKNRWGG